MPLLMRYLLRSRCARAVLLPLLLAASSAAAQPAAPLTYQGALDRALAANPQIAAARVRSGVAMANRAVAGERLNPELHVEFEKETPTRAYGMAFPLELGGKRDRRIAVSDAGIRTGEAELAAVTAEVTAAVRRAYYSRVIAEQRQALLVDVQGIAVRARDAAQARFDAGDAPRIELVQAQLAVADAENQAAAARGTVAAARADLNALLGFPLDADTPLVTSLDAAPGLTADQAVARARAGNAEIAVLDRRLDEQRARIALARALQTPDITPEATLTRGAEPEFSTGWRAAVGITLPIFTTHKAGVQVEEATLAQLTLEREATVAKISGAVVSASALADAQRQQFVRYRDEILPQALELERMAEDAYRLGQTGISAYLQALQSTRDVRLRAIQAAADFESALADLEQAMGVPNR
jgi:cobalt-zinc-cadmium efflux system outer membrane protein